MKHFGTLLLVGMLVAAFGCNKESTTGGPGTTQPTTDKAMVGQPAGTFTLELPSGTTDVKQGETDEITIGINRGKEIDQDVTLLFTGLPQGVTVEPTSPVIMHGEKETKFTLRAAPDAALGDFTVKLTGHPATGADATGDLKISVNAK